MSHAAQAARLLSKLKTQLGEDWVVAHLEELRYERGEPDGYVCAHTNEGIVVLDGELLTILQRLPSGEVRYAQITDNHIEWQYAGHGLN